MRLSTLLEAEDAANLFLKKLKIAKREEQVNKNLFFGSKATASLKRQSLELSNALVNLRKPG